MIVFFATIYMLGSKTIGLPTVPTIDPFVAVLVNAMVLTFFYSDADEICHLRLGPEIIFLNQFFIFNSLN